MSKLGKLENVEILATKRQEQDDGTEKLGVLIKTDQGKETWLNVYTPEVIDKAVIELTKGTIISLDYGKTKAGKPHYLNGWEITESGVQGPVESIPQIGPVTTGWITPQCVSNAVGHALGNGGLLAVAVEKELLIPTDAIALIPHIINALIGFAVDDAGTSSDDMVEDKADDDIPF